MTAFVLDASVAVSWYFPGDPEDDTSYSRPVLGLLATNDAIVPEIWAFEIANSIFVSFNKRKRITERQIEDYLRRLKELPIIVEDAAYGPMLTDRDLKNAAAAQGVLVLR
jgi:hypothetical protein